MDSSLVGLQSFAAPEMFPLVQMIHRGLSGELTARGGWPDGSWRDGLLGGRVGRGLFRRSVCQCFAQLWCRGTGRMIVQDTLFPRGVPAHPDRPRTASRGDGRETAEWGELEGRGVDRTVRGSGSGGARREPDDRGETAWVSRGGGQYAIRSKQAPLDSRARVSREPTASSPSQTECLKNGWGGAPVAPGNQQRALGGGVNFMRLLEKLDTRHLGHPLVRNQ